MSSPDQTVALSHHYEKLATQLAGIYAKTIELVQVTGALDEGNVASTAVIPAMEAQAEFLERWGTFLASHPQAPPS